MKMEKVERMRAVVGRVGRSATIESGTELDPGRRKNLTGDRLVGMILGRTTRWLVRGTLPFTNRHAANVYQ